MDMTKRTTVKIGQITAPTGIQTESLKRLTREEKYRPFTEYETIIPVKKHVNISLIVNRGISEIRKQLFGIQHTSMITKEVLQSVTLKRFKISTPFRLIIRLFGPIIGRTLFAK
jgi:hypothetical protein